MNLQFNWIANKESLIELIANHCYIYLGYTILSSGKYLQMQDVMKLKEYGYGVESYIVLIERS